MLRNLGIRFRERVYHDEPSLLETLLTPCGMFGQAAASKNNSHKAAI